MINKNFTLLWFGKIISQLGDKFYGLALAWWVLQETNSSVVMGFFLLVSALPAILFGLFGGALTDRFNRKTLLIVTDAVRGLLTLFITVLAFFNLLAVWQVYLIGFCLSLTTAFFEPAIQAIIPDVVPAERLPRANGLSQSVGGVCTVVGPLLGALTVSLFGITVVFFANSLSYIISALLSRFIIINQTESKPIQKPNMLSDIKEGMLFIKGKRQITLVLKIIAFAHLFMGCLSVMLPFLAKQLNGNVLNNLGFLEMMLGAGLIVGSLLMALNKKNLSTARPLLYIMMSLGAGFILISILQILSVKTVYAYLLVLIAVGGCIACASVLWQSLLQRNIKTEMAGRVFGVSTLIANTSLPLANAVFGVLLSVTSITVLTAVCGVGLILVCIIFSFQKRGINAETSAY